MSWAKWMRSAARPPGLHLTIVSRVVLPVLASFKVVWVKKMIRKYCHQKGRSPTAYLSIPCREFLEAVEARARTEITTQPPRSSAASSAASAQSMTFNGPAGQPPVELVRIPPRDLQVSHFFRLLSACLDCEACMAFCRQGWGAGRRQH